MITVPAGVRIYLACGATDMRRGFDGLSVMAQEVLKQDPFSGAVFCFRGRRGRSHQGSVLGRAGLLPVRQAAGEGPLHLAGDEGGLSYADAGAALDAVGRAGVAGSTTNVAADAGGIVWRSLVCDDWTRSKIGREADRSACMPRTPDELPDDIAAAQSGCCWRRMPR